jgi:methyl-accepting chemotaxis protein
MADEMSAASAGQSRGIEQIGGAIQSLEAITQQVAASATQSADVASELSGRMDRMKEMVGDLAAVVGT